MDRCREMPRHLKEARGLQPRLDLIGGSQELAEDSQCARECACVCVCARQGGCEQWELGKRDHQGCGDGSHN